MPSEETSPKKPLTLMVVDDSEEIRTIIGLLLRSRGYDVIESDSGATAIKEWDARKGNIQGVVCDIFMPGMDGLTLARNLRKKDPKVRILLTSGRINDDSQWIAEEAGFGLLKKPFKEDELFEAVQSTFEK
jgi:two-component system cell cycle sensor histidine kinase/response regulator CckA